MTEFEQWVDEHRAFYGELQIKAIRNCLTLHFSILTGGPGTGKTVTIRGFLQFLDEKCYLDAGDVAILAQTGKAVARINKELAENDLKSDVFNVSTITRFINKRDNENDDNIQDPKWIIIDEFSLVDVLIFSKCLDCVKSTEVRIMITGDANQLPSISAGNLLHDIIETGVFAHVNLVEVKRQTEGYLLKAINAIKDGKRPHSKKESDFEKIRDLDEMVIRNKVTDIARQFIHNPKDLMVLTPLNNTIKKYEPMLIDILNSQRIPVVVGNKSFAVGDRVMQTKNNYASNLDQPRFNGMTGTIQYIHQVPPREVVKIVHGVKVTEYVNLNYVEVEMDNYEKVIRYTFEEADNELQHAYVISVHKSQGSEADTVIIIMDTISRLNFRNLLYTAVSRARSKCYLVSSNEIIDKTVNTPMRRRKTYLQSLIKYHE
jgi:exodeoxyribonuclease V alpha subunit